jgi:hypothetical protein
MYVHHIGTDLNRLVNAEHIFFYFMYVHGVLLKAWHTYVVNLQ